VNHEESLLRAVVATGDLGPLTKSGVTADHFAGDDTGRLYEAIINHYARYSRVPAVSTLEGDFPGVDLSAPDEPIEVYLDEVLQQNKIRILNRGLTIAVRQLTEGDADAVIAALQRTVSDALAAVPVGDVVDLTKTGAERLERYEALKDLDEGMRGVPTGFKTIDRATLGQQGGQFTTLVGLQKGGKSTLLVNMAKYAHEYMHRQGTEFCPLIYGFEMSNMETAERFDSWNAGVDSRKLRAGELNEIDWQKLRRSIERLSKMAPFYLATGRGSLTGVSQIEEAIKELKPDALYLDGMYMMRDEVTGEVNSPAALTNITRALKRLAQAYDIPIIGTTQALAWKVDKKAGITAGSIGYSSSFGQDSDVVIAVESTETDEIKKLKIIASRNSPNLEVLVRWDWSTGTYEEIDEEDGGDYAW
jgi:replicative DNA helicase